MQILLLKSNVTLYFKAANHLLNLMGIFLQNTLRQTGCYIFVDVVKLAT